MATNYLLAGMIFQGGVGGGVITLGGGWGGGGRNPEPGIIYIYIYTWNPNDHCFGSKRPCLEGLTFKNRVQLGSKYIYI